MYFLKSRSLFTWSRYSLLLLTDSLQVSELLSNRPHRRTEPVESNLILIASLSNVYICILPPMPRSYRSSFSSPLSNYDWYVFFISQQHMSRLPQLSLCNCCHNATGILRAHCVIFPGYLQHSPQSASSFIRVHGLATRSRSRGLYCCSLSVLCAAVALPTVVT
jgi:hypothetical protein